MGDFKCDLKNVLIMCQGCTKTGEDAKNCVAEKTLRLAAELLEFAHMGYSCHSKTGGRCAGK